MLFLSIGTAATSLIVWSNKRTSAGIRQVDTRPVPELRGINVNIDRVGVLSAAKKLVIRKKTKHSAPLLTINHYR
jgi:hypothetical protein